MTQAQHVLRDLLLDGDLDRAQVLEVLDEVLPEPGAPLGPFWPVVVSPLREDPAEYARRAFEGLRLAALDTGQAARDLTLSDFLEASKALEPDASHALAYWGPLIRQLALLQAGD